MPSIIPKLATFSEHWRQRTVAQFNDCDVMVVKGAGGRLAQHDDTALFSGAKGVLGIQLRIARHATSPLAGAMYVGPKGVEHRPGSHGKRWHLLLIEPRNAKPRVMPTRQPRRKTALINTHDVQVGLNPPRAGPPRASF